MKKYIKADTELTLFTGSYLLMKNGEIINTIFHVPSTTYISRGILHLCPTDAEFLLTHGKIDDKEAEVILKYCLVEYLTNELRRDSDYTLSVFDITSFTGYADLRYAPTLRRMVMRYPGRLKNILSASDEELFQQLNSVWYIWLKNNFVKVSVFRDNIEFRICSENGYNWNEVIIDYGILGIANSANPNTRYTIVRESSKGYKAYFLNATLDEVLENDHVVLSNTYLRRYVVAGELCYGKKI